jgi:hypothetical protein
MMKKGNYDRIAAEIMNLKGRESLGRNDMTCDRNYASTVPSIYLHCITKNVCLFDCLFFKHLHMLQLLGPNVSGW